MNFIDTFGYVQPELQKKIIFSVLKFLGLRFGEENFFVSYNKFHIATYCLNPQFHKNAIFFSLLPGLTGDLHDISMIYP